MKLPLNPDEILKQVTSEAVKQGENIRATVRDMTLKALQGRELTLTQIKQVLRLVTEGVNAGAIKTRVDIERVLSDALRGMDQALLRAVEANRIVLEQMTGGRDFEQSHLRKALDDLERLEDEFLNTIKTASAGANEKIKTQWAHVLQQTRVTGTDTGAQAMVTFEAYAKRMQAAVRESRAVSFKAAHALTKNYATLASGVLIGISEAFQRQSGENLRPSTSEAKPQAASRPRAKRRKPKRR